MVYNIFHVAPQENIQGCYVQGTRGQGIGPPLSIQRQEIFYPKRPKLLFLNEAVFHLAERRYVAGILVIMVLHIRLEQWFLTGVRSNPKGSTKLFQGFGGRFPIF